MENVVPWEKQSIWHSLILYACLFNVCRDYHTISKLFIWIESEFCKMELGVYQGCFFSLSLFNFYSIAILREVQFNILFLSWVKDCNEYYWVKCLFIDSDGIDFVLVFSILFFLYSLYFRSIRLFLECDLLVNETLLTPSLYG